MDDEDGGGPRLSKRFSDKGGEVDYKTRAGTAWSHSYLNQKPWHPLSYPNQRRKWIVEQTHAQKERRAEEVAREYAQEQDFFRQTALVSKKEKEKLEMMKAVSFMYVRPPGYNAESAKAAEMADERRKEEQGENDVPSGSSTSVTMHSVEEKKKPRPKDVFGRALPTEEQFEVLKNAPRLETGVPARSKPFGVEIRNVKCLRCGNYGHQSGDRECPMKDAIMPNEESRLKRDDPLTAILAQTDLSEPLKWELKQRPGISPPRGGFNPDDPNQQIVAEDIFDEYGGFLGGDGVPELLSNFPSIKPKKKKKSSKKKHKRHLSLSSTELSDGEKMTSSGDDRSRRSKKKRRKKLEKHSETRSPENLDSEVQYDDDHRKEFPSRDEWRKRSSKKKRHKRKSGKYSESSSSEKSDHYSYHKSSSSKHRHSLRTSSESSDAEAGYRRRHHHHRHQYQ